MQIAHIAIDDFGLPPVKCTAWICEGQRHRFGEIHLLSALPRLFAGCPRQQESYKREAARFLLDETREPDCGSMHVERGARANPNMRTGSRDCHAVRRAAIARGITGPVECPASQLPRQTRPLRYRAEIHPDARHALKAFFQKNAGVAN
jgi:hypothetical protein